MSITSLLNAFRTRTAFKEDEPDLVEYFVPTQSLTNVLQNQDKCIVLGLKGVGKSAAYRYLTEFNATNDIVIDINPRNHTHYITKPSLKALACSHQFEYEMVVEILSSIYARRTSLKSKVGNINYQKLKEIKSYTDIFFNKLKEYGGRFSGVSVLGCGFSLAKKDAQIMAGLYGRTDELAATKKLGELLDLGITIRYVLDDPEEVFSAEANINFNLLGGLIMAAARLNSLSENIQVLLIFKTHVYKPVYEKVADLNQYLRMDQMLYWTHDEFTELIRKRVSYFCGLEQNEALTTLLGDINEADLSNLLSYVTENLVTGPRDLITWIYYALEHANADGRETIVLSDFKETYLDNYCPDMVRTLVALYHDAFPQLDQAITLIFSAFGSNVITREELGKYLNQLYVGDDKYVTFAKQNNWLGKTLPDAVPALLFNLEVIGLVLNDEYILPYQQKYTPVNFQKADGIFLLPALAAKLT